MSDTLPPGTTHADVDAAFGEPTCAECDKPLTHEELQRFEYACERCYYGGRIK